MDFSEYLLQLRDPAADITLAALQRLHDLAPDEVSVLRSAWPEIEPPRRKQMIDHLVEMAEDNVELNFDAVFLAALGDGDGAVRAAAVSGLWEYEDKDLIEPLLHLLEKDEEADVRAEAALALGRFVVKFEVGDLRERYFRKVEQGLRGAVEDELEEEVVRARALEAIGASGRPWVRQAILREYESSDTQVMKSSALHAMGRSCEPRWLPFLISELSNDEPAMRYEAANALGSLADARAVPHLAPLVNDMDGEVREAAIAALGQIGGQEAGLLLRTLLRNDSPGLREAAADALAEANLSEDPMTVDYGLS